MLKVILGAGGGVGLMFLLVKSGLLKMQIGVNNRNGNGNISEHRIKDLENHATIANREMGEIKDRLGRIESDVSFIRGKLDT